MQDNLSRCARVPLLWWLGGEQKGPWGSVSGAQAWPVVGHLLAAVGTTAQPTEGISSEHLLVMSWVCPEAWALISLSFLSHIIVCILIKHIGVLSSLSDTSFFFFFLPAPKSCWGVRNVGEGLLVCGLSPCQSISNNPIQIITEECVCADQ